MKGIFTIFIIDLIFLAINSLCANNYVLENCSQSKNSLKCDYTYKVRKNLGYNLFKISQENSKIKKKLHLEINSINSAYKGITHIRLTDKTATRYEVPRYILSNEFNKDLNNTKPSTLKPVSKIQKNSVDIKDKETGELLYSLFSNNLDYLEDFIHYDYIFPSNDIFGYGERTHDFKLEKGVYTIWPNDTGAGTIDDDRKGGKNLYGHQPFIMLRNPYSPSKKNSYIGVLFFNSNAQDLEIFDYGVVKQFTIGGIVEIFTWARESPIELIKVLHYIVGKPALPAYWSLGWHQSRWGYRNTSHYEYLVDNYLKHEIPIDTLWADIDYMENYEDFTIDRKHFEDLPSFLSTIKKNYGIHFVPILDMGIPNDPNNKYYQNGIDNNVFIISNYTSQPLINKVWPGLCVFPDFTNELNSTVFWQNGLEDLKNLLEYDGLWLDMNEPGLFEEGEVRSNKGEEDQEKNVYFNLTYTPGRGRIGLENHTMSLNGLLNGNSPFNTVYNLKPINTWLQNKITYDYLNKIHKRPFILSRSNFLGMGRFSNHWLGDNHSTFHSMKTSISSIFNNQMFGFNIIGADICGFMFDTTDELCARWTTLGAFYPFSRNHNNFTSIDQEPWALGELTLNSAKKAITLKYSILRYLYTQHFLSSLNGGVVFQPLFFQFPDISELIKNSAALNQQIMIGPSLLFAPALEESTNDYEAVFPYSNWNRFPSGEDFLKVNDFSSNKSFKKVKISGSYNVINLFIRGGHIISYQDLTNHKVVSSRDLKKIPLTLIASLDENDRASGEIIWDNENSHPDRIHINKEYLHVKVELNLKTGFKLNVLNKFEYTEIDACIDKIVIFYNRNLSSEKEVDKLDFAKIFKSQTSITKVEINKITVSFPDPIKIIEKDQLLFIE